MSNVSECPYAMSAEVQHQCKVTKGCDHGPAPLPEDLAIPLLTKMLVPMPYQAPEKKAKKKRKEV